MTRKTILITGCSSGIGYTTAQVLQKRGWHVFAACRKPEDCARLEAQGLPSPLIDYENPASIESGLAQVLQRTDGKLDALFNNGAYAVPGALEDVPPDALRAIFEANVFGWHDLTRRVIPIMRAQGAGHILQCSSVLGFITLPWRGPYNATKFAIEGLSDTLRLELAETGIHVVLIEPGPITSRIRQNSIPHFERWIDWKTSARKAQYENRLMQRLYKDSGKDRFELGPEAVAEKVWQALEDSSPRARYRVTTPTHVMSLLKRLLPTTLLDRILIQG